MRVLGSTMLSLQAVVLLLALPVAVSVNGVTTAKAWMYFAGAALLCICAVGAITKPAGLVMGWSAQVATMALGLLVPWLFLLGAIFAALWWGAIRISHKVSHADTARADRADAD